jgi:hypothetical protein
MFNLVNKTIIKYIICTIVVVILVNLFSNKRLNFNQYLLFILPIIGVYVLYDTFICKSKLENFNQLNKNSTKQIETKISTQPKKVMTPNTLQKTKKVINKIAKSISNNLKKQSPPNTTPKSCPPCVCPTKSVTTQSTPKITTSSPKTTTQSTPNTTTQSTPNTTPKTTPTTTPKTTPTTTPKTTPTTTPKIGKLAKIVKEIKQIPNAKAVKQLIFLAKKVSPKSLAKISTKLSDKEKTILIQNLPANKLKQVSANMKKLNIPVQKPKLSVLSSNDKEVKAFNHARKLTRKEQLLRMRNALYNHVISKYSEESNESQENRMISLAKDKQFMRNLFVENIEKPNKLKESFTNPKVDKNISKSISKIAKEDSEGESDSEEDKKDAIKGAVKQAVKQAVKEIKTGDILGIKSARSSESIPSPGMSRGQTMRLMTSKPPTKEENNKLEKRYSDELSSSIKSDNNWKYNQFNAKNMKSLGEGLQSWDKDYVILNTDKWAPSFNPPPVCKTEKSCPVCPNVQAGYARNYTTLREFNSSKKIMNADNINTDYVKKLNKGE